MRTRTKVAARILTGALAATAVTAATAQPGHAAPQDYDYSGTAQTTITGLDADFTFKPTKATVHGDLDAGVISSARFTVPEASSEFMLFGVLPTFAKVKITQDEDFTGTYEGDKVTVTGSFNIKLVETGHFGIGIPWPDCKTTKPARLKLTSKGSFDPSTGGTLTGSYQIPELSGCLFDTPIINFLITGKDNPISVELSGRN